MSRIFGKSNSNAIERTYANGFSYTPDGRIQRLKLGNGRWESAKFNNRLQVTELALGTANGDGSLWKLNYEYGELQSNGTVDTAKNTGNIAKQTVSFNGLAHPLVQTFKYDSLYRLTEAKETSNNNQTWKQTFSYDRFGNRIDFSQIVGQTQLTLDSQTLPEINPATNRFETTDGYSYDKNGNLLNDPTNGGRSFTFNGENRQTQVKDANNQIIGTYLYDGEGKRVKKITNLETTVFIYDGMGKLVAEYSTAAPPTNPTTSYTATDQLDSPRVITDSYGNVTSRRDFMPFGEELYADAQNRTTANKYPLNNQDTVRQRFTGYQKDTETQLDFAEARYYNNQHARFTAVDPLLASGKSANPQTFNRYVYVLNNPVVMVDTNGLYPVYWDRKNGYSRTQHKGFVPYDGAKKVIKGNNGYWYIVSSEELTATKSWRKVRKVIASQKSAATIAAPNGADKMSALGNGFDKQMQSQPARFGLATGIAVLPIAAMLSPEVAVGAGTFGAGVGAVAVVGSVAGSRGSPPSGTEPSPSPTVSPTPNGFTDLFRAVTDAELQDIRDNNGAFRNLPGFEVKYFSTTAGGAESYAQQTYGTGLCQAPYTLVQTQIPTELITEDMRNPYVDRGIDTVVVPTELLPTLSPAKIIRPIDEP